MNPLALRNYSSEKKIFYEEDFLNLSLLIEILNEVLTGESDLTVQGKTYLEHRISSNNLAQLIADKGGLDELKNGTNREDIETALKNMIPLQTFNFIQEADKSKNYDTL